MQKKKKYWSYCEGVYQVLWLDLIFLFFSFFINYLHFKSVACVATVSYYIKYLKFKKFIQKLPEYGVIGGGVWLIRSKLILSVAPLQLGPTQGLV